MEKRIPYSPPTGCRTWVASRVAQYEADLTILRATRELIIEQEAEIEELRRQRGTYRIALLALAHLNSRE